MNAFDRQLKVLKDFDHQEEAKKITIDNKDLFVDANRQNLVDGKTNEDKKITPSHTKDPYFKTPKAAKAYIRFKQKLPGIPKSSIKSPETPNLYINGFFHNSIKAVPSSKGISIDSNVVLGDKITKKFKNVLGVTTKDKIKFSNDVILTKLLDNLRKHLKL